MKKAIITGATSGIGKEFSYKLAEKGYNLIVIGRRQELLEKIKSDIEKLYKVNVVIKILNLENIDEVDSFINEFSEDINIEFLVNNAGYGGGESFMKDEIKFSIDMINTHIICTTKLSRAFGEIMRKNKKGYIINTSSMASFNTFKDSAMYCSTKSFITTFSQCLGLELKKSNVRVQALCPGFVRTDFHSKLNMNSDLLKNKGIIRWMNVKEVVRISLNDIYKNKGYICIPGKLNKLLYGSIKVLPKNLYYKIINKGWEYMD